MNRFFRLIPAFALFIVFSSTFWAGCGSDNETPPVPAPTEIDVTAVIVNPLAPAPSQVTQLTAQVAGIGENPAYEWEVDGGTLVDSTGISVQWQAPGDPGIYRVFVRASVGSAVDTMSTHVMVRTVTTINTGLKYTMYPNFVDGMLYYVGTTKNPSDFDFLGYHAYANSVPPESLDAYTGSGVSINGGYEFTFVSDGFLTSSITNGNPYYRMQPMNVYVLPYELGPKRAVSNNEVLGTTFRKNENLHPSSTADRDVVAWQYIKVGTSADGSKDLCNIRFRNGNFAIQTLTTSKDSVFSHSIWVYRYFRNVKPMFTPDEGRIVYFTDSTGTMEPCIIPVVGSEPVLAERRALMVDTRHGIFYYAGIEVSERTIYQWNPAIPTQVGFIDDGRNFCLFDYLSEHAEIVSNVGKVSEFVWDQDGKFAAVNDAGVVIATPGGEPDTIFVKERASDGVIGINWSPGTDDKKLGFRMVRKGASSIESFAALVLYSVNNDRWYFASPEIKPILANEPTVSYTWMRALFKPTGGMYVPVPVSANGNRVILYYTE